MNATATDTTEIKLAEMLQENTGRSYRDSGDYYGRNWEQNQGIDFDAQPRGWLTFWERKGKLDIVPTVNVYHFLKDRLEYNPELDERYREEAIRLDLSSARAFVNSLNGVSGIYGEGNPLTVNTYNGEDLLSQTIQYVYWTDDGAHVLLQIHGGCDAREGYTAPVAFDVIDEAAIFDNARATIYCDDCGKHWETDGGIHWLADRWSDTNLEDYPATNKRCAGVVWVDDSRNGHCPNCSGILNLAPWPA